MATFVVPDLKKGLSGAEAQKRLEQFGPNEFEQKREYSVVGLILEQFKSPLVYVLLAAAIVTLFLHEFVDTVVILLVVVVNAMLGFYQEFKAAKSLEALKSYLKPMVTVLRDGQKSQVLMEELVLGDVVYLDAGGSVPADGVVVSSELMTMNEAVLTGESRPVHKTSYRRLEKLVDLGEAEFPAAQDKGAKHFVYMGTAVSSGLGLMVVMRTGNDTEMGKIATSLQATEEGKTPLQERLARLARTLMLLVIGVTAVIFGLGVVAGREMVEMFETAVAIAVSAIPEGLVVSMTVILSLGMQRILRKKALVRKLVAAETLGGVSVICSDKTGTLTEGKMKVMQYLGDRDELVRGALLANDERDEEGRVMAVWAADELRRAGVSWVRKVGVGEIRQIYQRIDGIPFSSANKFMASLSKGQTKTLLYMSGAPEVVLSKCHISDKRKMQEMERIGELARKGFRLIGFATKSVTKKDKLSKKMLEKLSWVGVLAFEDPVREGVRASLRAAMKAGVRVKVITGDNKETAVAVLKQLVSEAGDLREDQVITGDELAKLSKQELEKRIDDLILFARTTPDQKLKIVAALREKGEVVAMTGDGVNDAPALKAADIGVVVNEATDVSKQTADMVLLDSSFKTIVAAIEEGRALYETLKKVVTYLLSGVFQEMILIGGAILLGLPLPITAVQILWVNLVEDGLPGVALAFDRAEKGLMEDAPRKREEPLLDVEMKTLIVVIGVAANLVLLGLFWFLVNGGMSIDKVRTFMFVGVSTNSLLYIFSIKSLRKNLWEENIFDNKFLLIAVGLSLGLVYLSLSSSHLRGFLGLVALSTMELGLIMSLSLLTMVMIEAVKMLFNRKVDRGKVS